MFNKPSNIEIINKINLLENKLDILLVSIDEQKKMSIKNKCHCKDSEIIVYNEIKSYINDKFTELENDLCNRIDFLEKNIDEIKILFNNYKNDVINNMEFIIDHIYKETQDFKDNVIFTKIKDMIVFTQSSNFDKLNNEILEIQNKIIKIDENTSNKYLAIDSNTQMEINQNSELINEFNLLSEKILNVIDDLYTILYE